MIRSVNIFKSTNAVFPIRIEFWDTDKLVEIIECSYIKTAVKDKIAKFVIGL